jgi:DNA-binding response OmpR family regulator
MVLESQDNVKGSILFVDDDPTSSKALQLRLEKRGFKVTTHDIGNGVEDMIDLSGVELVLLDIMLPDVSGIEVLRRIRRRFAKTEVPVIMVTAKDAPEDITGALHDGANDYLGKPINIDVALARINTQLSMRDLYRENMQRQRQDSINAMIVAFNHEINNPLAIAMGNLTLGIAKNDVNALQKAEAAMRRIAEIVRKINDLTKGGPIEMTSYTDAAQMIKIKG